MKIWVHGESLAGRTSSTPARGMLRTLTELRSDIDLELAFHASRINHPRVREYLDSLPEFGVCVSPLSRGRYSCYVRAFLGFTNYCTVSGDADLYLDLDMNYFGPEAKPLVVTLADLSTLIMPESASLTWHGARVWKHGLRLAAEHADAIVCISDATRSDLVERFPETRGRAVTVHSGIAEHWRSAEGGSHLRDPPTDGAPYWIWWGHVTERKNLRRLLRAYAGVVGDTDARASDETAMLHLVLVATLGHESRDLPNLVTRLGIDDRVHWLDPQPLGRLVALVDASEGLLFPSLLEGFGLPAVEALARGKKVLCSDRGALPEVTGGFAELCDPEDIGSLSAGMCALREQGDLSEEERAARRQWAARFTYERAASGYSRVIDRVLSGRDPEGAGTSDSLRVSSRRA